MRPFCYGSIALALGLSFAIQPHAVAVERYLPRSSFSNTSEELPLIAASKAGNATEVKRLLEARTRLSDTDREGMTPLMHASANGHRKVVEILLEYGADVNYVVRRDPSVSDISGKSALIFATENNQVEVIPLLMKAGAKTKSESHNSMGLPNEFSALEIAVENLKKDTVLAILENFRNDTEVATSEVINCIKLASKHGVLGYAQFFIEAFEVTDENYDNVITDSLLIAAKKADKEFIEYLISKGADVNKRSHDGKDAAEIAIDNGNYEASKIVRSEQKLIAENIEKEKLAAAHQEEKNRIAELEKQKLEIKTKNKAREDFKKIIALANKREFKSVNAIYKAVDDEFLDVELNKGATELYRNVGTKKGKVTLFRATFDSNAKNGVIAFIDDPEMESTKYRVYISGVKPGTLVEEEGFTLIARINGTYTYPTVRGTSNTIPSVSLIYRLPSRD